MGPRPGVTIKLVSGSEIHMGEVGLVMTVTVLTLVMLGTESFELCEIMYDPKCISLVSINSDLECGLKCNDIVSDVR